MAQQASENKRHFSGWTRSTKTTLMSTSGNMVADDSPAHSPDSALSCTEHDAARLILVVDRQLQNDVEPKRCKVRICRSLAPPPQLHKTRDRQHRENDAERAEANGSCQGLPGSARAGSASEFLSWLEALTHLRGFSLPISPMPLSSIGACASQLTLLYSTGVDRSSTKL